MFDKVLIANRGEIAVRIARTCREMGIATVAVHSDVDAKARHVAVADEAVHLPGVSPAETYLDAASIVDAAKQAGAQAIHPGYGFLSERASFASDVRNAGLAWVGPPAEVLEAVGDKISARNIATGAGVPVVPGLLEPVEDIATAKDFAMEHGYPVAIKAAGGGGGRGLKVAHSADDLEEAFSSARREAQAYFGDRRVFVERYLAHPKHLEIQILAPSPTEALWLGARDCSFQRRHQKLIEETPPPVFAEIVPAMGRAAVDLSTACGYVNAGTAEFLVDEDGRFYFLEVNARLQVEHTVTEEIYGIDLVACQLRIAAGEPLGVTQDELEPRGHALECRINAEDPSRGFLPTPGLITLFVAPDGFGVRVDSGYATGDEVPAAYDSLLAKLIAWGTDREDVRARMLRSLDEMVVEGVETTIPAHRLLLEEPSFVEGRHTTRTIEDGGVLDSLVGASSDNDATSDVLMVGGSPVRFWNPAMAGSAAAAVHGGFATGDLVAPMQGTILKVLVEEGDQVEAGQAAFVLEAMKMETTIAAPRAGKIAELKVGPGDTAGAGQLLASLE